MKYTVPDYYREFKCIASACPATCCAGWQIVIDEKALRKYRAFQGPFGNRLANSIDWGEKTFEQYGKRCAFLNEENLCDIYMEAGPDMLCRTCRRYPRHVEEFDNEREISLSVSCPVAAEMLLDCRRRVCFVEKQDDLEESGDEEFDFFLYSALQDCRKLMFQILQDRKEKIEVRIASVLALAHDVQNRIDARKIFEIEALLERYGRAGMSEAFKSKLQQYRKQEGPGAEKENWKEAQMNRMQALLRLLDELEVLDEAWPKRLALCRKTLYGKGGQEYFRDRAECQKKWLQEERVWVETELEQLMIYFLFTYFCGAVYDGDVLSKTKMAVASTLLLREMETAEQMRKRGAAVITLEERAQVVWRYSRELEHSDLNLNKMEELMNRREAASFEELMYCVMGMSAS